MEHVEVARAESERGEVVLRERRDPENPDGSHALELRVNGVFVMDTFETSSEKGLAAAALKRVENPRNVAIGGLGLGFTVHEVLAEKLTQAMRDTILPQLEKRRLDKPAFASVPRDIARRARWVKPELVAEIAFAEFTADNVVRHASFLGLRGDKPAEEVAEVAE